MEHTDADDPALPLLHRIAQGDAAACAELVDRHLASLHATAFRLLGDASEAEDVCQDVFLAAWQAARDWQPGRARFRTWMLRVATNACHDRHRKRRPEQADVLEALGASIDLHEGYVYAQAPRGLKGAEIEFPFVSVGATEHALLAAVMANGTTVLRNAAREPEIGDLARCLMAMGARIEGLDTDALTITGVARLNGATWSVIPDRIETGTYAVAAAMAGGQVRLTNTRADLVEALTVKLREAGVEVTETGDGLAIRRNDARLDSVNIDTEIYPGFATDLQAQFMALMTTANGESVIREHIFENRFMHAPELSRLGADISVHGGEARVRGVDRLKGAEVMATDLRASVSLVIAGLVAEGETTIGRVYHLDRGFERLEEKLGACGARIRRLASEDDEH